MKCPICKTEELKESIMDAGLKGYQCERCDGNWIRSSDYEKWEDHLKEGGQGAVEDMDYKPEYDSKKAGLCPECGRILIKYNVSNKLPFRVDHCGTCNGVWLDRNEWKALMEKDLHDDMNKFFTEPWQRKLREEMTKHRFEENYRSKFGDETYEQLKRTREWLYNAEHTREMIAFLMDDDPYKI